MSIVANLPSAITRVLKYIFPQHIVEAVGHTVMVSPVIESHRIQLEHHQSFNL